jgi:hypothetical protein
MNKISTIDSHELYITEDALVLTHINMLISIVYCLQVVIQFRIQFEHLLHQN